MENSKIRDDYRESVESLIKEKFSYCSYDKHNPVNSITSTISSTAEERRKVTVVGIAGPAGSGKTTLVNKLDSALSGDFTIKKLNFDNYFKEGILDKNVELDFSGHHPEARKKTEILEELKSLVAESTDRTIIFCYANAALLFDDINDYYDISIGVCVASAETLLSRREDRGSGLVKSESHFYEKTLPDTIKHTIPSIKHADIVYMTDSQKIFINNKHANTTSGQELFYFLSLDKGGWDEVWRDNSDKFGLEPSPLCKLLLDKVEMKDKHVIELGVGGAARDAIEIIKSGARYCGIDISDVAIRSVAEKLESETDRDIVIEDGVKLVPDTIDWSSITLIYGDYFSAIERLSQCDVIYSHSSLHYLPPLLLDRLLSQAKNKTNLLAISVKTNEDRLATLGDPIVGSKNGRIYENNLHRQARYFYSPEDIKSIIEKHGYRIEFMETKQEIFDAKKNKSEQYAPFVNIIASPR